MTYKKKTLLLLFTLAKTLKSENDDEKVSYPVIKPCTMVGKKNQKNIVILS